MAINRGEVYFVGLEGKGHEQQKERPCVVIGNDAINHTLGISTVVPIASSPIYMDNGELTPVMIEIQKGEGGLPKTSYSMAHQVTTVSHERFVRRMGTLKPETLKRIVRSVQGYINA